MRTLYDSTTAGDIPKSAKMVAGYVDGRYVNVPALRKRFPNATVVTITVTGNTPGAHVCDTEPGNIGPKGAIRWARNEVKAGRLPTLYCMGSQWPAIRRRLRMRMPVKANRVSWWVADYDNDPTIPKGAIAKQYADPPVHGKGHFDLSVVADYWPGVDPAPVPEPPAVRPLSRWQRALIRRVTQILNKTTDLTTDDRKAVAGLDAAALHALGGNKP